MNESDQSYNNEAERLDRITRDSMDFYDESAIGVRKVGMTDQGAGLLREALNDERTITARLGDGREVVAFVPLHYAVGAGYDADRCAETILGEGADDAHAMAQENERTSLVYMPGGGLLEQMDDAGYNELVSKLTGCENGSVFFSYSEFDKQRNHSEGQDDAEAIDHSAEGEVTALLAAAGRTAREVPMIDGKALRGHQEVTLETYTMHMPRPDISAEWEPATWDSIYDAYEKGVEAGKYTAYTPDIQNGTVMMRGSDVPSELLSEVWDFYQERFEWLGDVHPISMEDTRENFEYMVRGGKTLCVIEFHDGKPVRYTDPMNVTDDAEEFFWQNKQFITDPNQMDRRPNELQVYFPGLAASKDAPKEGGVNPITLFTDVLVDAKAAALITCETTNRSGVYIPRMMTSGVHATGRPEAQVDRPVLRDKTYYKCVKFGASQSRPAPSELPIAA